jgi:hypothetical protein
MVRETTQRLKVPLPHSGGYQEFILHRFSRTHETEVKQYLKGVEKPRIEAVLLSYVSVVLPNTLVVRLRHQTAVDMFLNKAISPKRLCNAVLLFNYPRLQGGMRDEV